MENKNLYQILDSVYKALRIPIGEKKSKIKPDKEKFIRKEKFETKKRISGKMKNQLTLKALSPVFLRNPAGNHFSSPDARLFQRDFDILSPVKQKIYEIEKNRKNLNFKFAKGVDRINNLIKQCQSESKLKDKNPFIFPKMQSARGSFGQVKEKNGRLKN